MIVGDHVLQCCRHTEAGEHEGECSAVKEAQARAIRTNMPYVKPRPWTMRWEGELVPFFAKLLGL